MRPGTQIPCSDNGFTLIEIIVTILLASVLAALMFQFMGTTLTGSSGPVETVRDGAAMEALMEAVISDYVKRINTDPSTALGLMKTDADTLVYGSEVTMAYIAFDPSGNETPSGTATNTLKVTVQLTGYSLMTLLTKSRKDSDDPVSKF